MYDSCERHHNAYQAMTIIYYRFVYSPSTGDVTLSHNDEGHPADVRLHSEMVAERPESDVITGYAYAIAGGWKLTDADHKPIEDPHIISSVERAIESVS